MRRLRRYRYALSATILLALFLSTTSASRSDEKQAHGNLDPAPTLTPWLIAFADGLQQPTAIQNAGDERLNVDLMAAGGRLSDVRELVLALQGDRKDMASVERVLRDKDALTIKILKSQYMVMTMGRSLDS